MRVMKMLQEHYLRWKGTESHACAYGGVGRDGSTKEWGVGEGDNWERREGARLAGWAERWARVQEEPNRQVLRVYGCVREIQSVSRHCVNNIGRRRLRITKNMASSMIISSSM